MEIEHLKIEPAEWPFEHFRAWEIACTCCGKVLLTDASLDALARLDWLRRQFGEIMNINSGYRCPEHNKAVGGATNSKHIEGIAFDIQWTRWKEHKRRRFLFIAGSAGFQGLGQYSKFVHIDARQKLAFWYG